MATTTKEYTAYVDGASGYEHTVVIEVDYRVELCGGIGYYEFWGHTEYDAGTPAPVDEQVVGAWVERNGKFRRISNDSWVTESALEQFIQNWEYEGGCE